MSNTLASMNHKIAGAKDLRTVVRTMKSVAAANIGQYEKSVRALADYDRTVELGLSVYFRKNGSTSLSTNHTKKMNRLVAVVCGSDQGLVGQFNDIVTDYTVKTLATLANKPQVFAVGERVHSRLMNSELPPVALFDLPNSVGGITPLIGKVLSEAEKDDKNSEVTELHLFYNRPTTGAGYEPTHLRLLPLDEQWRKKLIKTPWPSENLPEILGEDMTILRALIREYLFISLFRACAESLASENASRLAAMQRADKNINELLENLDRTYHRLRQGSIDEELFDVVSGFEALTLPK